MPDLHQIYYRFPAGFPLPFILDGATGTALMREGMPRGACTECWVTENPHILRDIQHSYARAGSDAVLTPTFGANRASLERHGVKAPASEFNEKLSAISRGIAEYTGGDISPTGLFMAPYGDASFEDIAAIYAEQARGLCGSVDFFEIETMISLAEARAAVTGIRSVTQKPVFVTLTVDKNGRTMSGDTLDASLLTLAALSIEAFGCNCSVGPAEMLEALRPLGPLSAALGIPLIAKPNAGMPREKDDGTQQFDLGARQFGEYIPAFIENGIYILGGCCGTDDSHIAEIRRRIPERIEPHIIPADISRLACTNKTVDTYKECTGKIRVTENIADDFLDSEAGVPLLEVTCTAEAEMLLECAHMLDRPFALCGDAGSITTVLRRYNGRPLVI